MTRSLTRSLPVILALTAASPMLACSTASEDVELAQISLRLAQGALALNVGQSLQVQASVSTASAQLYVVEYRSSAPAVVRVSTAGVLTGVSNGTATVTVVARLLDSGASATASVAVEVGQGGVADAGAAPPPAQEAGTGPDAGAADASPPPAPPSPPPTVACTKPPITGMNTTPAPLLARPALNVPFVDPTYGMTVARVTAASQVTDRDKPSWVRHEYSRKQPFNANSTRALMVSSNGWMRLYDVTASGTMSFVKTVGIGEPQEPTWHPTDPNKVWLYGYYGQGMTISTYDVATDQVSVTRNLSTKLKALFPSAARAWTKQEGRPSDDGRVHCLMVEDASYGMLGLVAYDMNSDTILGSMPTTNRPDHVSTSPKGDYCVPSWGTPTGTRAYKTDFSSYTQLHSTSEHSDLAVTKGGAQVYVYSDYNAGFVSMVDLATGAKTNLFALYGPNSSHTAMHISGTSRARPGYVTVSFYGCGADYGRAACDPTVQWFKDKIVAVELAANPRIVNLAHTHYGDGGYFAETQAVANPDLTKILFVSTWESSSEADVASYLLQVPSCALP